MSEQELGSHNLRLCHCDHFSSLHAVNFHFRLCHVQAGRMPCEDPCPCALLAFFTDCVGFVWVFGFFLSHPLNTSCSTRHCLVSLPPFSNAFLDNPPPQSVLGFTCIAGQLFALYLFGSLLQLMFLGGTTFHLIFCCGSWSPPWGERRRKCGWHWFSMLEDTVLVLTNVTIRNVLVAASPLVAIVVSAFKTNTGFACIGECAPITANGRQLVWIQQKLCCHNLQLNFSSLVLLSAAVIGSNAGAQTGPPFPASLSAKPPLFPASLSAKPPCCHPTRCKAADGWWAQTGLGLHVALTRRTQCELVFWQAEK